MDNDKMREQLRRLGAKRPRLKRLSNQARRPNKSKKAVRTAKPLPKAGKRSGPLKSRIKRKRTRRHNLVPATKTRAQAVVKRRSGGCRPCKRKSGISSNRRQ